MLAKNLLVYCNEKSERKKAVEFIKINTSRQGGHVEKIRKVMMEI